MLSILIPVYNRPVAPLVQALGRQCENLPGSWEILLADDGSTHFTEVNAPLGSEKNVRYHAFPENIGRAAIRNRLGELAQNPHLLYLDCDSMPCNDRFLDAYLKHLDGKTVIAGGTVYSKPEMPGRLLHYSCGTKREAPPLKVRSQYPYKYFKTNNFVIPASVKRAIAFDESLKQYGHEDTLFARHLKQSDIPVVHIDNPVVHEGLEDAETFLDKTRLSLENGLRLYREGKLHKGDIRAVDLYIKLHNLRSGRAVLRSLSRQERPLLRNVEGRNPNLYYLDLLKLIWLYRLDSQWSI